MCKNLGGHDASTIPLRMPMLTRAETIRKKDSCSKRQKTKSVGYR